MNAINEFELVKGEMQGRIAEYLSGRGVKYKKSGKYYQFDSCPFCQESGRFTVWEGGNYKCFGAKCGETGGLFDLVTVVEGLSKGSKLEALKVAAGFVGYTIRGKSSENEEELKRWQRKVAIIQDSGEFYKGNLSKSSRAYLRDVRGRTDEIIDWYGYGEAHWDKQLWEYLLSKGYSKDEILESGLAHLKGTSLKDHFGGDMIIYPIRYRGKIAYFRGKGYLKNGKIVEKSKRYTTQMAGDKHLWGVRLLGQEEIHGDRVLFVEGEEDWLSVKQANIKQNCVACLGTLGESDMKIIKDMLKKGATLYTAFDPGFGGRGYENLFLDDLFGIEEVSIVKVLWYGYNEGADIDDYLRKSNEKLKIENVKLEATEKRNLKIERLNKQEEILRNKEKQLATKELDATKEELLKIKGERLKIEEKRLQIEADREKELTTEETKPEEAETKAEPEEMSSTRKLEVILENGRDILEERMYEIKDKGIDGIFQMKKRCQPMVAWIGKLKDESEREMYLQSFAKIVGNKQQIYKYIKETIARMHGGGYKAKERKGFVPIEVDMDVIERGNHYVHQTYMGENVRYKVISNFLMTLASVIEYEGKYSYEVMIENEQNERTKEAMEFGSSERTDKKGFCNKLSEIGRYAFYGSQDQLQMMWMYITMNHHQLEGVIRRRSYLGYLEEDNVWLFENCAISEGEVFLADDKGDVRIGTDIYRSDEIDIYSHKKPRLYLAEPTGDKEVEEIFNHYWTMMDYRSGDLLNSIEPEPSGRENYDEYNTFLAFGWLVGNVYLQEWVHEAGFFPFLEYYGQKGSGKTYAMQILMMCMGLDKEKARESWGGSRANIAESMKYLSNLPYYLDEYMNRPDNDMQQAAVIGYLRNTYTRTPYTRGRGTGGKEILPLRSSFCYSGQARTNDSALLSRTVLIWKQLYKKKAQGSFEWLWKGHSEELSRVILHVIVNKTKKQWEKIKDNFDYFNDFLEEKCPGVDIRQRNNYSMLAASVMSFDFLHKHLEGFIRWLIRETQSGFERVETENIVYQFLVSIDTLFQEGIRRVVAFEGDKPDRYLYIAFSEAFSEFKKHSRELSVSEDITEKEMREYMKNDPSGYYIDMGKHNKHRFYADQKSEEKRCIKIELSKLPENLREACRWGYI